MVEAQVSPPAAARREQILALVDERGFAKVGELSRRFHVSEVTVRADLDALAEARSLVRVHGGAVAGGRPGELERPFEQSLLAASDEKARIGRAAAGLVESGQAIVLDVGTTTTAIAAALLDRADLQNVVVITNALNIALILEAAIPRFTVVVTGGTLRPLQHSLVEPLAGVVLDHIRADLVFIGCSGVDVVAGVTNVNLPEADMKRRMLATAARRIVVADSTKLGRTQLSRVAPLDGVDTLITGTECEQRQIDDLISAGLAVIRA
ncbi:MAG TPA: DeoR/GlpR family DNA-binding transcription regulator [Lacisediminihabitans sp.]|uniref:DeoR/GlpR family DNA-binding transcription regulator n=1 Tax=Lacisediminihabitans sp. TaxID=2787631 RepID=UPI002ED9FD24